MTFEGFVPTDQPPTPALALVGEGYVHHEKVYEGSADQLAYEESVSGSVDLLFVEGWVVLSKIDEGW